LRPCAAYIALAVRLPRLFQAITVARRDQLVQRILQGEGGVDLGIKGLRVLVTAGAGGIGREVARATLRAPKDR